MESSLVNGTVTKIAGDDGIKPLILRREGQPGGDGKLRGDNAIATQDAVFVAPHMHGAAFPLATAGDLAEEFGHDLIGMYTLCNSVTMLAVTAHNFIGRTQRGDAAHTDRLLTNIQVHETADLPARIFLRALLLEAAQQGHHIVHF